MNRAFVISPANIERAKSVVDYAIHPEHWYDIADETFCPGDHAEYVAHIDPVRCVFTITVDEGRKFRHLSVSLARDLDPPPEPGKLPSPTVVFTVATWFGFTGATCIELEPGKQQIAMKPGPDWEMAIANEPFTHVILLQEIHDGQRSQAPN